MCDRDQNAPTALSVLICVNIWFNAWSNGSAETSHDQVGLFSSSVSVGSNQNKLEPYVKHIFCNESKDTSNGTGRVCWC